MSVARGHNNKKGTEAQEKLSSRSFKALHNWWEGPDSLKS